MFEMDAEKFQKIKDIFAEVLEQPAMKREKFLRAACEDDESLLCEVKSLLEAFEEPENLIEKKSFDLARNFAGGGNYYDGKRFGNYRIVREIGRGGMGTVFLAERDDGEFRQTVALKIVRQTIADAETEKRFRLEREILASLNHPFIARLLDGGVAETGEPFLAMEFVEGETLLEFASGRNLSVEENLRLFLKVCAAVAYAHRNLTVHRDIKPSNILVTADGEPKLLDFGLARILDEAPSDRNQTETAFRAFTPAYASPEQMLGKKVTTASDVYSLGVVFYELLTGAKPFQFEGKSLEEIIRTITDSDPPAPSAVTRFDSPAANKENPKSQIPNLKLRGDLDNIALKALQKEAERRYGSVEEFAGDIERHLRGLPVNARPATLSYRAAKFFGRNKIAVSAAALVILSLVTGLIFTLWQANETRKERDRAEARFNDVRKLSNSLLFEITPKIERLPGAVEARQIIINRALEYLDSLASESQTDLELQAELASAYEKIGDLQGNPTNPNFVRLDEAIRSYEKAQNIRRKILEAAPADFETRRKIAENNRVLGGIYGQTNDYETEQKYLGVARALFENLLAENPHAGEIKILLAQTDYDAGVGQTSLQSYGRAIPFYDQAIATLQPLAEAGPNRAAARRLLGNCYAQKGYSLSWESRQRDAEAEMQKAIAIHEKLAAEDPSDTESRDALWLTYWLTGNIYEEVKNDLFYEYQTKATRLIRAASEREPSDLRARQRLAKTLSHLGQAANNIGKPAEAIAHLAESSRIYREIIVKETRNSRLKAEFATSLTRAGSAEQQLGNAQTALENLKQAVEIYLEINAQFPNDKRTKNNLATAFGEIAKIYEQNPARFPNATAQAKSNYQKALDLMLEMQAQNVLSEYDLEFLELMKTAVRKFSS